MKITVIRAGSGRYLRWDFKPEFFDNLSAQAPARQLISQGISRKPVFVDGRHGGPLGSVLKRLLRPVRLTGLAVQIVGKANPIPCETCHKAMLASDSADHWGMHPFFGCVGVSSSIQRACGNDIFMDRATSCSYHTFHNELQAWMRGVNVRGLQLDLHHDNTQEGLEVAGEDLQKIVKKCCRTK